MKQAGTRQLPSSPRTPAKALGRLAGITYPDCLGGHTDALRGSV
jgi:hypothetical protein